MSDSDDTLADRVMVLRDEVLDTAELGDPDPPGAEIFDAIVRAILEEEMTRPGLDLTLYDAVSRRLAWGEREELVLADADTVCQRLLAAIQRAFRDPADEVLVAQIATEVVCATARMVAQGAMARAGHERAAMLRNELVQRRLQEALERQREELERLSQLE